MKSIYLDQNVFGHLLDKGDWKTHPIGKVLDDHDGDVGVWVSLMHGIKLSQATNHARRSALARLMLELCGTRRMWHIHRNTAETSCARDSDRLPRPLTAVLPLRLACEYTSTNRGGETGSATMTKIDS